MSLLQNIVSFIGLFCKRDLWFEEPTNRSHPIYDMYIVLYLHIHAKHRACIWSVCLERALRVYNTSMCRIQMEIYVYEVKKCEEIMFSSYTYISTRKSVKKLWFPHKHIFPPGCRMEIYDTDVQTRTHIYVYMSTFTFLCVCVCTHMFSPGSHVTVSSSS